MLNSKINLVLLLFCLLFLGTGNALAAEGVIPAADREVTFESAGFTLYGTLSLPEHKTGEKVPVCVLVHGSGPADRDESFVDSGITFKIFGELAAGLKKQGFAVLRYDKRVVTMLQQGKSVEELNQLMPDIFVTDARAALDYVKSLPEIDANRVILVGHSEGAGFAPRIAEGKQLAGVVLLGAPMMPIRELCIYQLEYQIKYLNGYNAGGQLNTMIAQIQTLLDQEKAAFDAMDKGSLADDANVLGATVKYWKRWQEMSINPVQQYVSIQAPVLMMTGLNDLKCPWNLLQDQESALKMKKDLKIIYIDAMIHELYHVGTTQFESAVYENIAKWARGLPGFTK